jgi:predicted O-methyltransferase YrrM
VDFVFFDGNHQKQPTINYFEICLQKAHEKSVFVFDDIHWSEEMEQAWAYIKNHPKVTVTIDLFWIGIVFFRTEQVKEHFIINPYI